MSVPRPFLFCLTFSLIFATFAAPLLAASLELPVSGELAFGIPHDVAISGNYAYVAAQGALSVFDISIPAHPVMVAIVDTPGSAEGVAVSGNFAYVADWDAGLRVINITDPTAPVEVGSIDTPGYAYGVAVSGSYAYVADHAAGLRIINISAPAFPSNAGSSDTPGYAWSVAVSNDYAYVADGFAGLRVLNVSNPAAVTLVDTFAASDNVMEVAVNGNYVYYTDGVDGLGVLNITTPATPVSLGTKLGAELDGSGMGLFVSGNTLYLASGSAGLYAIDISTPSDPTVLDSFDTPGSAYAVAVSGTAAVVADDSGGLRFIDIASVPAPTVVSQAQTTGNAEAIAVNGDYAYVADANGGLVSFDLSDLRVPDQLWTCTDGGLTAMDVALRDDYAYVADWNGNLKILDISDPLTPACTYGSCATGGHPNGLYLAGVGGRAYLAAGEVGLVVVNASNPASPSVLMTLDTSGTANDVVVAGNYAYIADGANGLVIRDITTATGASATAATSGYAWGVDYAGNYAYLASGDAGLEVFDVSNPASPTLVASLGPAGGLAGSSHSVVVAGDFAYVSAGGHGVTVVDITDPENPSVISTCGTPSTPGPSDLTVSSGYAYVADAEAGLVIVDVMQPFSELAKCESPAYGEKLDVVEQSSGAGLAYVAGGIAGLQIIQVSDAEEADDPALIRTNRSLGNVTDFDVALSATGQASLGYVTDASGHMTVMNLTNPTNPFAVTGGELDTPGSALGADAFTINGSNFCLVADGYEGVSVISTVVPTRPARRAVFDTPGWCSDALGATLAEEPFAVVADGEAGLRLLNISPVTTTTLQTIFFDNFELELAEAWTPTGAQWYNSSPRRGLYSVRLGGGGSIERNISTELHSGVTVSFYMGAANLEAGEYVLAKWSPDGGENWNVLKEIAHVEDPDLVTEEDGTLRLYSYTLPADADDATSFLLRFEVSGDAADDYGYVDDVTVKGSTSEQPTEVGFYNTPGQARGVAVAGNYVCVADGTAGVQVVDVTAPGSPTLAGSLDTAGYAEAITRGTADTIFAVADGDNGLLIVDIKDPEAPIELAHYDTPGWASDVKVLSDHAYVADTGWGLTILPMWYSFQDILFGNWAFSEIEAAVEHGITVGYNDGLYHPELVCARDQMAVFIARALAGGDVNVPDPPAGTKSFEDIDSDYWAYKYIEYCYAQDIVDGYQLSDDKYYYLPTRPVDRALMAVFMARAVAGGDAAVQAAVPDPTPETLALFEDVLADHTDYKYIYYCVHADTLAGLPEPIVRGYPDGLYRPNISVTRDQMAVYLYRAFDLGTP